MARKDIHNALDMRNKNNHNDNFEELYQLKEVISDLVLESGESNAEVVQARGGKKVLADRLDGIEDAIMRWQTHQILRCLLPNLNTLQYGLRWWNESIFNRVSGQYQQNGVIKLWGT